MIALRGVLRGVLQVVNNKGLPRFTRFHTMQALLVDVSLALPRLLELVFTPPAAGYVHGAWGQGQDSFSLE